MIRRFFLLSLLVAGPGFSAAQEKAAEEGFTRLFNGKDLSGWVNVNCAPETWTVREGMIHCDGVPTGALRTERQYENFILELEWRHLKPGGNAGVFVWAGALSAPGVPFLRAIEVQVLDHAHGESEFYTTHGDVFPIHGATMKPLGRHNGQRSFPSEKRSKPSPEWNQYRITCQDGVLKLAVNGKEVSGGEECSWRKGYIALESEGGTVDWRNIQVKELLNGKTPATAEQTAPVWDGSVSLYNGRDLKGWTATGAEGDWKAENWELKAGGKGGVITMDRKLKGDFRLQFDVLTDGKFTRVNGPLRINGEELPAGAAGGWVRYTIVRRGTEIAGEILVAKSGGKTDFSGKVKQGAAEISFKSVVPVSVAGVYVRE